MGTTSELRSSNCIKTVKVKVTVKIKNKWLAAIDISIKSIKVEVACRTENRPLAAIVKFGQSICIKTVKVKVTQTRNIW